MGWSWLRPSARSPSKWPPKHVFHLANPHLVLTCNGNAISHSSKGPNFVNSDYRLILVMSKWQNFTKRAIDYPICCTSGDIMIFLESLKYPKNPSSSQSNSGLQTREWLGLVKVPELMPLIWAKVFNPRICFLLLLLYCPKLGYPQNR